MPVTIGRFLRNALYADILFSTGGAILMAGGAPFLSPLLGLPTNLLLGAGLVLVPWVAALLMIVRRRQASRTLLMDIVGINVLWAVASVGLAISGWIAPTALGTAFVSAQAFAVALFAALEFIGIQRTVSPDISQAR